MSNTDAEPDKEQFKRSLEDEEECEMDEQDDVYFDAEGRIKVISCVLADKVCLPGSGME